MMMRLFLTILVTLASVGMLSAQTPTVPAQQSEPMNTSPFNVSRIIIAATNVEPMAQFYQSVFQTRFDSFDAMGTTLYEGALLGFRFLICSNTLANVDAKQSRHQFEVLTRDLDGVVERAAAAGGTVRDDSTPQGPRTVTVYDPDGNSTVFIEQK